MRTGNVKGLKKAIPKQSPLAPPFDVCKLLATPALIAVSLSIMLILPSAALSAAAAKESGASQPTAFAKELDSIQAQLDKEQTDNATFDKLGEIISKEPTNYRAHLLLGNCYDKLGLPEQAQEEYRLATKYGPNEPKAYVELIKSQVRLGQPGSAMILLAESRKKFPKDPEVQFWVGNWFLSQNKFPEAEAAYMLAMEQSKYVIGLFSALAEVRLSQGRYAEAIALADGDISLAPQYLMANRVKGLALKQLGRYGQATKPLGIAFKQAPNKEGVAEAYAKCAYWSGHFKEAVFPALITLEQSASMDANNPVEKNLLEQILRKVTDNDLKSGLAAMDMLRRKKTKAAFHFALGDVLDRIKKPYFAVEQYRLGLEKEPTFYRGWYRLGKDLESYYRDYDQALLCYQKAHAFKPEDREISYSYLRLADRIAQRKSDLSWQLKDIIKPPKSISLDSIDKPKSAAK